MFLTIKRLTILDHYYGQKYYITTLRKEYSLLKKDGIVELKTHYHRPYPALAQKSRLAIKTHLSYKHFGPWDGKWRLIIFDIPKHSRKERLILTHRLRQLSFASIQKSAFASAFPLLNVAARFATDLGIRQYLRLMEVEKIDNEKETLEKVWNLKKLTISI